MKNWIYENQDILYVIAAFCALFSFLITAFIPKISGEVSEKEIKNKIDSAIELSVQQTIEEITGEIEGVVQKVDSNALASIETVKQESEKIISDLKTETDELKVSLSTINADTKELIDFKDAENIRIVIEFEISNSTNIEVIEEYWQFFVNTYLKQNFSLRISGEKFEGNYEIKEYGFSRMVSMDDEGRIYSTKKNLYFLPQPYGNPRPNLKFVVGFNLINLTREGKVDFVESGYYLTLVTSRNFIADNDFSNHMSSIVPNYLKIKSKNKEWQLCELFESHPDFISSSWVYEFKFK